MQSQGLSKPALTLVTGAAGFVGQALLHRARQQHWSLRGAVRFAGASTAGFDCVSVGDIGPTTDWSRALAGCDTVIHLAARVHVMREFSAKPLEAFCRTNALATAQLARQAAACGVRRLVYASTIKVHGEATQGNQAFRPSDTPAPQDFYALSKWQAEQALHQTAHQTGLEVVILRPALVHGPGVRGNFLHMLKVLNRRMGFAGSVPLPFAGITNQRHMLHVENFADALLLCAVHPLAAGNTYLVADDTAFSTPDLLRCLADGLGVGVHLLDVPPLLLRMAGHLSMQSSPVARLVDSLQVDSNELRQSLGWNPPFTAVAGLRHTAAWYGALHQRT